MAVDTDNWDQTIKAAISYDQVVNSLFHFGSLAQVMLDQVNEALTKRFAGAVPGMWEVQDEQGHTSVLSLSQVFGALASLRVQTLRTPFATFLVLPFVQCQRGDLAVAARLLDLYHGMVGPAKVLVVAVTMTYEEVRVAKQLGFEVISYLTDEPLDGLLDLSPAWVQVPKRKSKRLTVLWEEVFENADEGGEKDVALEARSHLDVKTWQRFFEECRLDPTASAAYIKQFDAEALELNQLPELEGSILKEFKMPMGHQLRVLATRDRLRAASELRVLRNNVAGARGADPSAAAATTSAPAPQPQHPAPARLRSSSRSLSPTLAARPLLPTLPGTSGPIAGPSSSGSSGSSPSSTPPARTSPPPGASPPSSSQYWPMPHRNSEAPPPPQQQQAPAPPPTTQPFPLPLPPGPPALPAPPPPPGAMALPPPPVLPASALKLQPFLAGRPAARPASATDAAVLQALPPPPPPVGLATRPSPGP